MDEQSPRVLILGEKNLPHTLDWGELIARIKGPIASFKIPRQVIFVNKFPMTSSGRIRKVERRAQALDILAKN